MANVSSQKPKQRLSFLGRAEIERFHDSSLHQTKISLLFLFENSILPGIDDCFLSVMLSGYLESNYSLQDLAFSSSTTPHTFVLLPDLAIFDSDSCLFKQNYLF